MNNYGFDNELSLDEYIQVTNLILDSDITTDTKEYLVDYFNSTSQFNNSGNRILKNKIYRRMSRNFFEKKESMVLPII